MIFLKKKPRKNELGNMHAWLARLTQHCSKVKKTHDYLLLEIKLMIILT